jgi:hypothetical protein
MYGLSREETHEEANQPCIQEKSEPPHGGGHRLTVRQEKPNGKDAKEE